MQYKAPKHHGPHQFTKHVQFDLEDFFPLPELGEDSADDQTGEIGIEGLCYSKPSKDNGLVIEGIAVRGDRIFLGLRGPVLRGWAVMLELKVEGKTKGRYLKLKRFDSTGLVYKRYFLELNGLGIRDLCFQGKDLIILAWPTMAMFGSTRLYRLKHVDQLDGNELIYATLPKESKSKNQGVVDSPLELLYELPFNPEADNAEGMTTYNWLKKKDSVMVVYDSPDPNRFLSRGDAHNIYADIFQLQELKD